MEQIHWKWLLDTAPVTCLSLSPDSNYLVTGSRDSTVLLWRIHRASKGSSSTSETPTTPHIPATPSRDSLAKIIADKSLKRRIEGPIHVLRGHHREILRCCVSTDLGMVVSCGLPSDALLHSMRTGCLIRRLAGVEADAIYLSSEGIVLTWNQSQQTLSTFTLNGVLVARAQLTSLGSIGCMEISVDSESALIGMNSTLRNKNRDLSVSNLPFAFWIYILKVFYVLELKEGQDITALALNEDNTNLLVSTADKQLIVFTDPALSSKSGGTKA
ncbi:hypothetical protein F3Y22_tig00111100pilonHSYRG00023 [Hibiscus syriacus]|uniref:Neurobeachin beta-propeller domain-containing protein n=1 Tax=Hibiscus syriacus TaxID=106335 RepID=A0A6A2Z0E3_HIBSY|nr:hypothetical protein F3Y22_tig00111100pilonHSYRG00023 [Hibiscus syriacus]